MKNNSLKFAILVLTVFALAGMHSLQAVDEKPAITISSAPNLPPGEYNIGNIAGKVAGVNPADCRVVVYAYGDMWYVQPWAISPMTTIKTNGTWQNRTHGGYEYAALLVKPSYQPASNMNTLPEVGGAVLAIVKVKSNELK